MITFILCLVALVVGFLLYGTFVERVFGIDEKAQTPALTKTDGVDYVPMKPWRIFLIQFLNIAGLGPIFGAIMGIFFGPAAFLWIVFGTIFAGGVHDYLSGMLSIRKGGASLPDIIGDELGNGVKLFMRVLSLVLLILLTTTFLSGPATLLQGLCGLPSMSFRAHAIPIVWVLIIFAYYVFATILPVDKLIGRFLPYLWRRAAVYGLGDNGGNARLARRRDARTDRRTAQPTDQRTPLVPDDVCEYRLRSHLRISWNAVPSDGAVRNQREARTLDILRCNGG